MDWIGALPEERDCDGWVAVCPFLVKLGKDALLMSQTY